MVPIAKRQIANAGGALNPGGIGKPKSTAKIIRTNPLALVVKTLLEIFTNLGLINGSIFLTIAAALRKILGACRVEIFVDIHLVPGLKSRSKSTCMPAKTITIPNAELNPGNGIGSKKGAANIRQTSICPLVCKKSINSPIEISLFSQRWAICSKTSDRGI